MQLWLDAGLELGNHTYSHPDLHRVTADEYEADILRGEIITRPLAKESGKTLEYFRHPFLHTGMTPETKKEITDFLAEHGYRIAPVTVDNSEWIFNVAYINANGNQRHAIASEYLTYMELTLGYYDSRSQILFDRKIPQILLLHSNSINADYLEDLVTMMTRRGYRFVSLQEALKDPAYELPDTFTGREGISWIQRWALAKGVPGSFFVDEPPTPKWIQDLAGIRE